MGKVKKIDLSAKRLGELAEKYLSEGKYPSALRFTFREIQRGGSLSAYFRICDIYEAMGLNSSAINYWFKILDECDEEDLPDVYEGLAVNYLNMGKDAQAAFYYNCLIESDDEIPEETKYEIAEAFSEKPKSPFKISHPPELADYKKEVDGASRAIKKGDCKKALKLLDGIPKGAKDYEVAMEMRALAYLLTGEIDRSIEACSALLEVDENNVRALSTLAAAYLEKGEREKSRELALRLCKTKAKDEEERFKIATVCCENGLHEEAYERFAELEKEMPFDGRMLYFKGVSAFESGKLKEAIQTFEDLCAVYPDAAVVEYYLKWIKKYESALLKGEETEKPKLTYFYQVPKEEREIRCDLLMDIMKQPKAEAEIFGIFAHTGGLFRWCFDELDGMDHDLQYLACLVAERCRTDDFLREILLDNEVLDLLKIEILRLLYERNEETTFGVVLCHVYRKLTLLPIQIGRKSRKKMIEAYARTASKFVAIRNDSGLRIKQAAEKLYRALEKYDSFDLMKSSDDGSCAIYLLAEMKDVGAGVETASLAFDANPARVRVLLTTVASYEKEKENGNGTD
ncbi:MAG: hypothetical protein IJW58_04295 [Clostridia bacterium]|nr:hypothetical protein [Clostridia bacterium]